MEPQRRGAAGLKRLCGRRRGRPAGLPRSGEERNYADTSGKAGTGGNGMAGSFVDANLIVRGGERAGHGGDGE